MPAKFKVTLTVDERQALITLISKGKAAARKLVHARILLKADATAGPNWSDAQITTAIDVGQSTVHRVRQAFVEDGLESALNAKRPTERQYRKLDGIKEARLVALACGAPPEGRQRWTLQLLAGKLVELKVVDSIGPECVRTTLKKMNLSLG